MSKWITSAFVIFFPCYYFAQFQVRDSSLFDPQIAVSYAVQFPGGDMADRFGINGSIGLGFHIKTRTNWWYGVQGIYLFGKKVTEPELLSNLYTSNGEILDNQGQVAVMYIQERGFAVTLEGGHLFDFIGPNPNSGLLLTAGVGILQHKIRIEHQLNEINALSGDYLKGYDRLTNGLALRQVIGYAHMSNNRLINFFIGVEAYEGITKNRRDLNFDTRISDDKKRLDILLGIRAGWVLHLYRRAPNDAYFY
ncbi:MAG: hypothetical protein IT223_02275 [Crocinitomicaceae bacterium]|nr:hypothetical protein [Crocinitomicaceae bacterium]